MFLSDIRSNTISLSILIFVVVYLFGSSPSCEMEVNVPSWAKEHITLQRNAPRYDLFDEAILEIESDLQTLVERCAATSERFADALDANELAEVINLILIWCMNVCLEICFLCVDLTYYSSCSEMGNFLLVWSLCPCC